MKFPRDKVKFSTKKTSKVVERPQYLAQRTYRNVMYSLSPASLLESGVYVCLLTGIARQCSIYRTIFLKTIPDEKAAKTILVKWIKTMPLDKIS